MVDSIILGRHVQAKAVKWGGTYTDSRGKRILDVATRFGFTVKKVGNSTTFRRLGYAETIPDITLFSADISRNIVD